MQSCCRLLGRRLRHPASRMGSLQKRRKEHEGIAIKEEEKTEVSSPL